MKKLLIAVVAAVLFMPALMPAAFASGHERGVQAAFYGGLELGSASYDPVQCEAFKNSEAFTNISCDENALAGRVYMGIKGGEYFAGELGYTSSGDFEIEGNVDNAGRTPFSAAYNYFALDASLLGILPFSERFSVHGRLGAAYTGYGDTRDLLSADDNALAVVYGVGAAFQASEKWGLSANYTVINAADLAWGAALLGGSYRF